MKSVIIVQARMGSSRLPGKVLLQAAGKSLLEIQISRLQNVRLAEEICIATTRDKHDDVIERFCREKNVPCYRGPEEDVLSRYYEAALFMNAGEVTRITADCPLIDYEIVDRVIQARRDGGADYASNTLKRTFPRGLDAENFSFSSLETAWKEAKTPWEREHVTPFLYSRPERFSLKSIENDRDESAFRWTVDTPEDFRLVSLILQAFSERLPYFSRQDVLRLLTEHPVWSAINAHVEQKKMEGL